MFVHAMMKAAAFLPFADFIRASNESMRDVSDSKSSKAMVAIAISTKHYLDATGGLVKQQKCHMRINL